jgi:hypothetical protein
VAAAGQFSWPPAGSYLAVYGQFLVAVVKWLDSGQRYTGMGRFPVTIALLGPGWHNRKCRANSAITTARQGATVATERGFVDGVADPRGERSR